MRWTVERPLAKPTDSRTTFPCVVEAGLCSQARSHFDKDADVSRTAETDHCHSSDQCCALVLSHCEHPVALPPCGCWLCHFGDSRFSFLLLVFRSLASPCQPMLSGRLQLLELGARKRTGRRARATRAESSATQSAKADSQENESERGDHAAGSVNGDLCRS